MPSTEPVRRSLALLTVAAAVAALAAGCGGSGSKKPERTTATTTTTVTTTTSAATGRPKGRCSRVHNSHAAVECDYERVESLDPNLASRPPLEKIDEDRSRCEKVTEAVFYAASDWMRLARVLAEGAHVCATYGISIPPVPDDEGLYTMPRPNQVGRLRTFGTRFHALAEIRVNAWQQWLVKHPGRTWFDAGVEARKRMEAAGYDVAKGDTWALNELMIPLLTDGQARENMRDLVRGLYVGGKRPARGVVFTVVPLQNVSDVGEYKDELEAWLEDAPFWTDMDGYVSVWADEVYVNAGNCCVGDATLVERAGRTNEYMQHRLTLVEAGPEDKVVAAKTFLRRAYLPLGNGAWEWDFGFGNTEVRTDQMERLISEQTFAMRRFSAERVNREAQSRIGFAWAPRSSKGTNGPAFVATTEKLLRRMSESIRDSAREGSAEAACGPRGKRTLCSCDVPDAEFVEAWESFGSWG